MEEFYNPKKAFKFFCIGLVVLVLISSAIFLRPKKYEVIVRDSLGYLVSYWEDLDNVEVLGDSIVSMNSGLLTYALEQGETVEIDDYTY